MMRLLLAFLVGIALPYSVKFFLTRDFFWAMEGWLGLVELWPIWGSALTFDYVTHVVIYVVVLGAFSWPMRSRRRMIWVTLAGSVGTAGAILALQPTLDVPRGGLGTFVVVLSVMWILAGIPLYIAVLLRARWSPIHPPGHCRHCGYNLTGNVSGVCPECGTEAGKP